jgi:hypothetical protein
LCGIGKQIHQHIHRIALAVDGGFAVADGGMNGEAIEEAGDGPWADKRTLGSFCGSGLRTTRLLFPRSMTLKLAWNPMSGPDG